MRTFTVVDGQSYPGTLVREHRRHPTHGYGFFSYLSADLGGREWLHVEKWDFDEPPVSEDVLRARLAEGIRSEVVSRGTETPDASAS